MSLMLDGKIAFITGAAGGIGTALVARFLAEGAFVIAADLDDASLARLAGPAERVLKVKCDVTSEESCAQAVRAAEQRFGRIDILVNNAGFYPPQPFETMTFADWRRVMAINLDGAFLMTRACVPSMKARKWGRIISMGSGTVFTGTPRYAHYAAAKSGVVGFTRVLASELGAFGITANVVSPGLTVTPAVLEKVPAAVLESRRRERAIQRDEVPEDLVGVIAFLASEDAGFMTGQVVNVDGGQVKH